MRTVGPASGPNPGAPTAATAATAVTAAPPPSPPAAPAGTAASTTLESAALRPALAALRDMPEIDHAKVAELRDALARGAVPFNAARLASLIERFHGGKA